MPNILFRADAEKSIGTGDLMSLIYLSSEFKKNSWKYFFAARDYALALKIIKQHELDDVHLIPHAISLEGEINLIKEICRRCNIDCLLMEVTKNKLPEYKTLGKPVPIKACINFDGVITEDFDIVVNWCVDSSADLYERYREKNIQFILGFENTVLPYYPDRKPPSEKSGKKVKNILICMGGVDEFDVTSRLLQALSSSKTCEYEIRLIAGPGYENQKDLTEHISNRFRNFTLKQDVGGLLDDYRWADIAFSAGGLTSSELVAAKVPAILIATHEHQIKRCEYYSRNRWAYYAGYYNALDEEKIIKSLNYTVNNIGLFRDKLRLLDFKGGNEKIYKSVDSCRQSKQLV